MLFPHCIKVIANYKGISVHHFDHIFWQNAIILNLFLFCTGERRTDDDGAQLTMRACVFKLWRFRQIMRSNWWPEFYLWFAITFIKSLISTSPKLKSIHFDDSNLCNISNECLFEVCKKTNIYISFGYENDFFDDSQYPEYKDYIKKSLRQLEMERYFCTQDFEVHDKYQCMKNEFFKWLNKDFSWFNCRNS